MSGKGKSKEGRIVLLNKMSKKINLQPLKIRHSRMAGRTSADTHFSNTSKEVHTLSREIFGENHIGEHLSAKRKYWEEKTLKKVNCKKEEDDMADDKKKKRRPYVVFSHKMKSNDRRLANEKAGVSTLLRAFETEMKADPDKRKRFERISKEFSEK